MRFETVRLAHAQGVPNHYVSNQTYTPVDEDHHQRGTFFILIDHSNTKEGIFLASLVNTLIREYYRQPGTDILEDFEQTLIRVNNQINQYRYEHQDSAGFELNGMIVLTCHDEIHISHIGHPQAYLWRENSLVPLVDPTAAAEPSFSVITSGEVKRDDILTLTTPLENHDQMEADLGFALKQVPLFEAGRAYARILKHRLERHTEGVLIRFNDSDTTATTIYVDRPLESFGEKLQTYQSGMVRHGAFVFDGVKFLVDKSKQVKPKKTQPAASQPMKQEPKAAPLIHTEDPNNPYDTPDTPETDPLPPDDMPIEDRAETIEASETPLETLEEDIPSDTPYRIKSYWQADVPEPSQPETKPSELIEPESLSSEEPQRVTSYRQPPEGDIQTTEHRRVSLPQIPRPSFRFKLRTLYILLGAIVLLVVVIRTANGIFKSAPQNDTNVKQTTEQRDALVAQAEAASREGEAAQVNDDTAKAISSFMSAVDTLKKVTEPNQNEKSKALLSRAETALRTVTLTTQLTEGIKPQTTDTQPTQLVATPGGTFILNSNGSLQKYTGDAITAIKDFGKHDITAATTYDAGKKVALLTKDLKLFSLDTASGAVTTMTRTDSEPWPEANHLASFDKNLYFIGDTMSKAIPSGDSQFTISAYNKTISTGSITSIVNNIFFYALEGPRQLVRIDSKSPKNPVAFTGIPDQFLPQTITRILSPIQEGVLYLWDRDGQRVMEFTTDGVYHKQWKLPAGEAFIDCDLTAQNLFCISKNKQIKTFALTST